MDKERRVQRGEIAYSKSHEEKELKVVLRPRPACIWPFISEPITIILGKHKLKSILRPRGPSVLANSTS